MATKFLARFKLGAGINGRRAYRAYRAGQYEAMFDSLRYLKPDTFVSTKEEDMTIIHHAAYSGDLECVDVLKELPYFEEIVNDNTNVYEWTPALWATTKRNLQMVKKLRRYGANLMKPK